MRTFEIMPRNPEAKGLEFQSSIYEPISNGHNLICEVYTTAEARNIKRCLNTQPVLLEACEGARALIRIIDKANPGSFSAGALLLALDSIIAQAKGE